MDCPKPLNVSEIETVVNPVSEIADTDINKASIQLIDWPGFRAIGVIKINEVIVIIKTYQINKCLKGVIFLKKFPTSSLFYSIVNKTLNF